MKIGITCYPTFGGSGIVATELGLALARRGHGVHFICTDLPRRLEPLPHVRFHPVHPKTYPVLPHVPYELALTSAMVSVAQREGLDLLHAHYAVPHATSAWMAREVLGPGGPKVVTTLHGTDITLVGADPSYLPVTRHSIAASDAVTAPSAFLARETRARFDLDVPITVIPNFVDTDAYRPGTPTDTIVHVSNFRPVKRVDRVVDVFARVVARRPARLLLVGDGPERPAIEAMLRARSLPASIVGDQVDVAAKLRDCAVFLLPSETESFGLAALEALASGVPVVASAVGGLPEVVRHGETGFLVPPDDLDAMAARTVEILDGRHPGMAATARADAIARFHPDPLVDQYESLFRHLVG